jgi:hypothetical protein
MSHKLDFINRDDIIKSIQQIDKGSVPKSNEWSEYWINYKQKLYQFKYVVEVASKFAHNSIKTTDFTSNDSSRNYVASLGFQILFKTPTVKNLHTNYWVGASYYGLPGNQTDMSGDFYKNKYWRTDHDLDNGEGLKIYALLQKVQINDRLCIRYFDKKGGKIHIALIGTVSDVSKIKNGRLGINWDYNPPMYKGVKPSGAGSGNWWKTIFQLKNYSDIQKIFSETLIEKRVARLAWNDNGWIMPSGTFGKSDHQDSHEAKYGYGHEEWLFDTSKLIKGFHYGFLEPVGKEQDAYSSKVYDVWLYTINKETRKRFWIGEINNLIVIDRDEADDVKKTYIEKSWLAEMEEQIKVSGANEEGFSSWQGIDLFNVKFKPVDIFVNDPYFELSDKHPIHEQSRYSFAHLKSEYIIETEQDDTFNFNSSIDNGEEDKNPRTRTLHRQPKAIEIVYLHKAISDSLTKVLRLIHGKENVTREHHAGYGANKIDIVVQTKSQLIFYEIKTYNSLKTSVREAFGQLIEYCYYPNKRKANELIIVTQLPADKHTKIYFKHLRETFKLPIYYQAYNIETKTLSEKI